MMFIGWVVYLVIYFVWLLKKKPYKRNKVYEFPQSGLIIAIKRW